MGTVNNGLERIDIVAMRQGNQITLEQRELLNKHVTEEEIK